LHRHGLAAGRFDLSLSLSLSLQGFSFGSRLRN